MRRGCAFSNPMPAAGGAWGLRATIAGDARVMAGGSGARVYPGTPSRRSDGSPALPVAGSSPGSPSPPAGALRAQVSGARFTLRTLDKITFVGRSIDNYLCGSVNTIHAAGVCARSPTMQTTTTHTGCRVHRPKNNRPPQPSPGVIDRRCALIFSDPTRSGSAENQRLITP